MDDVDRVVEAAVADGAFPGAAWQAEVRGAPVSRGARGFAVVAPERIRATTRTLWDLASLTKVVVATVCMRLVERGLVRLDDPVGRWFPAFSQGPGSTVVLRQLLAHTSGLPGLVPLYHQAHGREAMLAAVCALPLRHPPGAQVEYTSQGFMLLGAIVERVADAGLETLVAREINAVLGTRFRFTPPAEERLRIAATEDQPARGGIVWGEVHDENCHAMGGVGGHAGLFGELGDVVAFGRAMLGEGTPLLSPAARDCMTRCHTEGLGLRRGLGWQLKDPEGSPAGDLMSEATFGHTGFTGTSLFCDPVRGVVAVLLTNRVHPTRANERIFRVRALFHNAVAAQAGAGPASR